MAGEATRGRTGSDGVAVSTPVFVGRDRELATVVDALAQPPALVFIEGEVGIGKTRLAREVLASEAGRERRVLVAACPPLRDPFPLGPVVAGLRRLRHSIADVELSRLGGALRPLLPEWADDLPAALEPLDDPAETRHRLFRAVTELVDALGVDLLVVEDAHWADTATLEWLLTLTAAEWDGGEGGPSIVVTYRPEDVPAESLLWRLTSRPPAGMTSARVNLEPLDVEQARLLIASMLATEEVSEQFAGFLHERTAGIPLALEETVVLLRNRQDLVRRRGGWARRALADLEVPPTLRDSVLERTGRLDAAARQVLEAAAVLGEPAEESLLGQVAGFDEDAARRGMAGALSSGLLQEVPAGRFRCRHVLVAQAVYEAIPVSERRRLHHRATETLREVKPKPVVQLARHYREAGDVEQWCHYAEAAADLALESGGDQTAVTTLLELLTSMEHPADRRARLARKLGEAAFFGTAAMADLVVRVVRVLRATLSRDDLPQGERGELRLLLGRMLWRTRERATAFEEFEAAVPDLQHRPDLAIRAMSDLAMPLIPEWTASRHLRWLDRAGNLAGQVPSLDRLAFASTRATVLLLLGEDEGWRAVAELPVSASDPQEWRQLARSWLNVAWSTLVWGRYDQTRRWLTAAVERIQQTGYQRLMDSARLAELYLDWYVGAWHGLDQAIGELAEVDGNEPVEQLEARQIAGLLALASGARASAGRDLQVVVDEGSRLGLSDPVTMLAPAALARLQLADGTAAEALRLSEPVVALIAGKGVWLWATDIASVHLDALVAIDRLDEAETLVEQFTEGLAGRDAPAPAAALVLCRGIVADAQGSLAAAAELYAQAAQAWAALPRPYDELLALERQGRCLLAADDHAKGVAVLTDVEHRLTELGARWDADRVAHLMRGHGVEVNRPWRGGRRGYGTELSPRELEIVRLVAKGLSNREVAEILFISHKTVAHHVSGAMRKLDVTSRTALVAGAAKAGMLPDDGADPVTT